MNYSPVVYHACPVCSSTAFESRLRAKDYTVSGQYFEIMECPDCGLRFTQNVPDEAAIAPFYKSENYISHSDTQRGLLNRIYHQVRKSTLKGKYRLVSRITGLESGCLLDVGAGTGAFAGLMQQQGWRVTGVEPDAGARNVARQQNAITLLPSEDFFQLPDQQFDAITLWHVLEHVHALQPYMAKLKRLLKPGGYLFIAVPNYKSADARHYGEYWAAYDVPRHLYHFSPTAMKRLLEIHGLHFLHAMPMRYDSYYVSLLSEKYKTGRQHWLRAAWNGWQSNRKAGRDPEQYSSIIYIAAT